MLSACWCIRMNEGSNCDLAKVTSYGDNYYFRPFRCFRIIFGIKTIKATESNSLTV